MILHRILTQRFVYHFQSPPFVKFPTVPVRSVFACPPFFVFVSFFAPLLQISLGRISAGTFPAGLSPSEAAAAGGVQEMTKVWVGWVMGITPVRHARSCSLSLEALEGWRSPGPT